MIYIDFIGGSHGNYLEYVCNKFLAKIQTNDSPFNHLGSSHNKVYKQPIEFSAWHYFEYDGVKTPLSNSKIISIRITEDDLLPMTSVSLLRAADRNLDNNVLEIDTYNKLDNKHYKWVLKTLINSFFQDTRVVDYYNVKDPNWPNINTVTDFEQLPKWIRDECEQTFGLLPPVFSKDSPDCPRYILREFFKIGFQHPENNGFMIEQKKMTYDTSNDVYVFPYSCFYNYDDFVNELTKLAAWTEHNFIVDHQFTTIHNEFLKKQIYKNSKIKCDQLLNQIINREQFILPELTLLEESYLDAKLEIHYNKTALNNNQQWFLSSTEILQHYTN